MNEDVRIIREYVGKTGKAIVEEWRSGLYHASHTNKLVNSPLWTKNKTEAIMYAQFLSRY